MKTYINPEINVIEIVIEDILTASNGGENGSAIELGYSDLWN